MQGTFKIENKSIINFKPANWTQIKQLMSRETETINNEFPSLSKHNLYIVIEKVKSVFSDCLRKIPHTSSKQNVLSISNTTKRLINERRIYRRRFQRCQQDENLDIDRNNNWSAFLSSLSTGKFRRLTKVIKGKSNSIGKFNIQNDIVVEDICKAKFVNAHELTSSSIDFKVRAYILSLF